MKLLSNIAGINADGTPRAAPPGPLPGLVAVAHTAPASDAAAASPFTPAPKADGVSFSLRVSPARREMEIDSAHDLAASLARGGASLTLKISW